jgi:hypothetical protein
MSIFERCPPGSPQAQGPIPLCARTALECESEEECLLVVLQTATLERALANLCLFSETGAT